MREGSVPGSDSARSHGTDLEAGTRTAIRGGPAGISAPSEALDETDVEAGLGTANRGGPAETSAPSEASEAGRQGIRHGMVLPFQPVTLTFRDVHYCVDLPAVRRQAIYAQQEVSLQHRIRLKGILFDASVRTMVTVLTYRRQ